MKKGSSGTESPSQIISAKQPPETFTHLLTRPHAFKAIIETRLKALLELSSVRLLEEIRAAGYAGGYTQLKQYRADDPAA